MQNSTEFHRRVHESAIRARKKAEFKSRMLRSEMLKQERFENILVVFSAVVLIVTLIVI